MSLQMSAVMLGVEDLARAKKFYEEGLGCTIDQGLSPLLVVQPG
jgi:uncharacterized protein